MKAGDPGPRRATSTLLVENKKGGAVAALDFAAAGALLGVGLLKAAAQSTAAMKSSVIDITADRPTS